MYFETNKVLQSSKQKVNLPIWFVEKFVDGVKLLDEINSIQTSLRSKNEIKIIQNEIRQIIRKIRSGLGDKTKNPAMHNVFNQLVVAVNQTNFQLVKIAISLLRNKRLLSDTEFIRLRFS